MAISTDCEVDKLNYFKCLQTYKTMNKESARHQMVRHQVVTWNVLDEDVLALLREAPRDSFVPSRYVNLAYADLRIPLPQNQAMMTPGMEGRLLQSLRLEPTDRVLEIGTGSGFLTSCLAQLCDSVVSIDIFDELLEMAAKNLDAADIENVTLQNMNAFEGLPVGPFDAIAITGSIPKIDTRYIDALRPGGRLFVLVGEFPLVEAFLIVRGQDSGWYGSTLFETDIQSLIGDRQDSGFLF
jgi:protein-L-isoaspartate(D-aspartate) O-methyltransferase